MALLRRPQRSRRARTATRRQPLRHLRCHPGLPAVADSFPGSHRQQPVVDGAFAPLPLIPAYSISKAAAFSLTQSLRALLAGRGVRVHAVLTGPTDTDMNRGLDIPKASAESVARAIFDGVENGEEDIFPDPMSQSLAESWRGGAVKAFERQIPALVAAAARRHHEARSDTVPVADPRLRDGSRADGDARARRRILGRRGPADERDGHGRRDPARLVRVLHRPVGADDGGDDAAGRGSGRRETRSCQRPCARRAAVRRVLPCRLGTRRASPCTRCTGRTGPSPPARS